MHLIWQQDYETAMKGDVVLKVKWVECINKIKINFVFKRFFIGLGRCTKEEAKIWTWSQVWQCLYNLGPVSAAMKLLGLGAARSAYSSRKEEDIDAVTKVFHLITLQAVSE